MTCEEPYEGDAGSSADALDPEAVIAYKPSSGLRSRAALLIDREKCGQLSAVELEELDGYMTLEHEWRLAKARARKLAAGE